MPQAVLRTGVIAELVLADPVGSDGWSHGHGLGEAAW